jgi:3'-phosphoadenosine 5'-phosphosulfate sulfotransferase (PAPS reductase)/FAD synthetase
MAPITLEELKRRQALPLEDKIRLSNQKIMDFAEHFQDQVYVAFSGGKDSTVLLSLVRSLLGDEVPAVHIATGLEYPEISAFVKTFPNVEIIKPEMTFKQVVDTYGYPVGSKMVAHQIHAIRHQTAKNASTAQVYLTGITKGGFHSDWLKLSKKWYKLLNAPFEVDSKCCDILKKNPLKTYEKETGRKGYVGTMTEDSMMRKNAYLKTGCNSYGRTVISKPLSFWLEKDIWEYIKLYNIPYCSIYDTGVNRTGCMFCMFGIHLEKAPNRFQLMKQTHPAIYNYCMEKLNCKQVLQFLDLPWE